MNANGTIVVLPPPSADTNDSLRRDWHAPSRMPRRLRPRHRYLAPTPAIINRPPPSPRWRIVHLQTNSENQTKKTLPSPPPPRDRFIGSKPLEFFFSPGVCFFF